MIYSRNDKQLSASVNEYLFSYNVARGRVVSKRHQPGPQEALIWSSYDVSVGCGRGRQEMRLDVHMAAEVEEHCVPGKNPQ